MLQWSGGGNAEEDEWVAEGDEASPVGGGGSGWLGKLSQLPTVGGAADLPADRGSAAALFFFRAARGDGLVGGGGSAFPARAEMRQKIVLSVRKRMTGFSHRKSDTGQKNRSKSLHPFDHDRNKAPRKAWFLRRTIKNSTAVCSLS